MDPGLQEPIKEGRGGFAVEQGEGAARAEGRRLSLFFMAFVRSVVRLAKKSIKSRVDYSKYPKLEAAEVIMVARWL